MMVVTPLVLSIYVHTCTIIICRSEEVKQSRVNKEGCKGREVKKLMKMQHTVHLISSNILKLKTPQVIKKKQ